MGGDNNVNERNGILTRGGRKSLKRAIKSGVERHLITAQPRDS